MQNIMEVFFDNENIFPYVFLDVAENIIESFNSSSIYFVLSTDKLKIISFKIVLDNIIIKYKNINNNKCSIIHNLKFFPFYIPSKYIHLDIVLNGAQLEVGIKSSGVEFLKRNYPYIDDVDKYSTYMKVSIYDLVTQSESYQESETEYEIIYIGKSKNIKKRLFNHQTIQKIQREHELKYQNKEIFIMLLNMNSKLHHSFKMDNYLTDVLIGSANWKDTPYLEGSLDDSDILSIVEAIFIQEFQPKYNIVFANSSPTISQKTYKCLLENDVDEIDVGLNLYMQAYKNIISLKSDGLNTKSHKLVIFKCDLKTLKDQQIEKKIDIEMIDNKTYELLML